MTADPRTTLAVAIALDSVPKSLTWLAFATGAKPSEVSRSICRLMSDNRARYVTGRGFIAWSLEQQDELESRLADDVCRDLLGRAYGE